MQRIAEDQFLIMLSQAIVGASYQIDVALSPFHPEWIQYVHDIAYLSDSRLPRRLLLPGFREDFEPSPLQNEEFIRGIRAFLEQDWEVRSAPYSRLGFAILIDETLGFHSLPNPGPDPAKVAIRRPEFSLLEGDGELRELVDAFEDGWGRGEVFETIYHRGTDDEEDEEEERRLVRVSNEPFQDLIRYFAKHPEKMREMDPHKFEEFIAGLFEKEGFQVELAKMSRDGGRDILVTSETTLGKHLHLVECKRYAEHRRVDVTLIRCLYGVVERERATAGMLVTTTRLTTSALQEIDQLKSRISKKDYDDVVKWIRKHA